VWCEGNRGAEKAWAQAVVECQAGWGNGRVGVRMGWRARGRFPALNRFGQFASMTFTISILTL